MYASAARFRSKNKQVTSAQFNKGYASEYSGLAISKYSVAHHHAEVNGSIFFVHALIV